MSSRKITIKSKDGETFVIEEAVALKSQTIKDMIEDSCAESEIHIQKVNGNILRRVIEYCKKHVEADNSANELKTWDADFIEAIDMVKLFQLLLAANYLKIESLSDLACQVVADMTNGTPEVVRKVFTIENDDDLNPTEEEVDFWMKEWGFDNLVSDI